MLFRVICTLIWLLALNTTPWASEPVNDVRILIDTSGSMKKTDPINLRVPALKLLVNLLPAPSRAGVWLFDTSANRLLPPQEISPQSRAAMLKVAGMIHSRGLNTDIESALRAATQDWTGPAPAGVKRTVILLTDGMVDLPKGADASAQSRQRILDELLPHLQSAGVVVHTVGLSEQSDRSLLQQISLATTGSAEVAQDAQQLQRNFVRIFNRVVPKPTLPIKDNRFSVDSSIEEMTILVFLKPEAKPTQLITPGGNKMSGLLKPDNVLWVHEPGYDLITVQRPETGIWGMEADIDPGNQVMVVTHLKMDVTPIPAQMMRGEWADIAASFSENGKTITRKDFLELISVASQITEGDMTLDNPVLYEDSTPTRFQIHFTAPPEPGRHRLTITADGKTFQRQSVLDFILLEDWITVLRTEDHDSDPPRVLITLLPSSTALMADSLSAHARLTDQKNSSRELEADHQNGNVIFSAPLPGPDDHWIVNLTATAKKPDGSKLEIPLKPIHLDGQPVAPPPQEDAQPEKPTEEPAPEPAPETPKEPPDAPKATEAPVPSSSDENGILDQLNAILEEANWIITLAITAGVNLAIAGLWFWAYRMMKKRQENLITNLISKLNPSNTPHI